MAVIDDIKQSKGYILGIIAFATAVATFLCTAMGFRKEPTITAVTLVTVLVLFLSWLIDRSEKRQIKRIEKHNKEIDEKLKSYDEVLKEILNYSKENQLATLRIEMGNVMVRQPENHDTILKYAEKYFIELGGDWVQTDAFFEWAENERDAGRAVHMPPALMNNIQTKRTAEVAQKKMDGGTTF